MGRRPYRGAGACQDAKLGAGRTRLSCGPPRLGPHARSHALVRELQRAGAAVTVQLFAGTNHRSLARTPAAMRQLGGWLLMEVKP